VQFRYAFVTTKAGLEVVDITAPAAMRLAAPPVAIADARSVYVSRTWAYVAAGADGIAIVDVTTPTAPKLLQTWNAEGVLRDTWQVKVGMVNDSVYGIVADGKNGMHVVQLVTPEDGGRSAYGFAPEPRPKWIARRDTVGPAVAIAEGLERDRAVDESGHQVSVFGRIGGRPFNLAEMQKLYLRDGKVWTVADTPPASFAPQSASK